MYLLKLLIRLVLTAWLFALLQACGSNSSKPKKSVYAKAHDYCQRQTSEVSYKFPKTLTPYEQSSHEAEAKSASPTPPALKESYADCMMNWQFEDPLLDELMEVAE